MSHDPSHVYPNTPLHKYPHLAGDDIPVWRKFITAHGHLFTGFQYDFPVGVGLGVESTNSDVMRRMWTSLTQKRIDVLGLTPRAIYVIEVKGRPGMGVLGQALGYPALLRAGADFSLPLIPLVVGGIIEPDIETILDAYLVKYYDVSDDHNNLITVSGRLLN